MIGLDFEVQAPVVAPDPNRADIACFVGFVGRRATALPGPVRRWLGEQGWTAPPYQRPLAEVEGLLNLPTPIDTWETFDHLFAWDRRALSEGGPFGSTYLGAAVRSFFAQGGRKCYVVRVGDPWPLFTPGEPQARRAERLEQIEKLIPERVSPVDRAGWRSLDHLFGLPDVSFLCLPDLADAVRAEPADVAPPGFPPPEEQFVECTSPAPPRGDNIARYIQAPRCDEEGYEDWAREVSKAARLVARHWREAQLVVAIPPPLAGGGQELSAERDLLRFLTTSGARPLAITPDAVGSGIASAFVQLAYPWARTPGSANLPERLESPDGVLAGLLARNAITRGAFRGAANLHLADVYDLAPLLAREQMLARHSDNQNSNAARHSLLERVSLLGPTPSGWRLLSDVTTSLNESYRPAGVNRLVSVIVRAARRMGEESVFEPSSERLWAQLRDRLGGLLTSLYLIGALGGASPAEAFQVRCDRSTMTQNDIDNGRVIARVEFVAAAPIERITVVLAMDEGGQVSLLSARTAQEVV
jgi:GNAT superfamily N-acetyltransferase